jgi:hypothetical protein
MQTQSRRRYPREPYEAPIQYVYLQPDRYYTARMYNFSQTGLYFEPAHHLEPNTQIKIIMPNYAPDGNGPESFQSYSGVIRWCRQLSEEIPSRFGVGVEIIEKSHERFITLETQKQKSCELCDELLLAESVCRLDGTICLCPNCFHHFHKIPESNIKSSVKRFLDGNVI